MTLAIGCERFDDKAILHNESKSTQQFHVHFLVNGLTLNMPVLPKAMTPENIVSGFCITGIFSHNIKEHFFHHRRLRFSSDADIVRLTNARIIIIIITSD